MFGESNLRKIAQRVLAMSRADETEASLYALDEKLTRFANNVIHQNVAETDLTVVVRTALGKRVGVAATNDLSDAGLERAVEAAMTNARTQPEDPDYPGMPEPAVVTPVAAFDERTAAYSPASRARDVAQVCRRAEEVGVNSFGAFRTAVLECAIANSHGLFVHHAGTVADLTVVTMTDDSAGYSAGASWRVDEVDVADLGWEAIERALKGRNPQPLPPGVYPVVLEGYAAIDIVAFISQLASGMLVAEGRSWMNGREGQQVVSPLISIWDDGRDPGNMPLPFDAEGMPRQRVDILRQGVAGSAVYDRYWAARVGAQPTGHALPTVNPFSPWLSGAGSGPLPLHSMMGPGEHTVEEMIASTERGLYVTRFHYTRTVHPRDVVVTGMTRDGLFLIENGEITTPVQNLRFTQSYLEALAGVEMVGKRLRSEVPLIAITRAPALKLSAFHFTSATTF